MISRYLFIGLITLLVNTFIRPQQNLYEFESAYVKKITTTTGSGVEVVITEEIYITDYGKKTASYKNEERIIKSLKKIEKNDMVQIVDGDWIIVYDPQKKQGTKRKNILSGKFKNVSDKEAKEITEDLKNALNSELKDLGFETVAGKKCKVTSALSTIAGIKTTTKTWIYKNFNMKTESESLGNKVKEEVLVFREGDKIDNDKFAVPKNIKIEVVKF